MVAAGVWVNSLKPCIILNAQNLSFFCETKSKIMAKPVSGIKPPSPLNLDSNISDNWKIFKQKWENYTIITELDKQEQKYQVALLQHTIGDDALRI